ncbi:MAG TPA: trehalose-phosphatase [Actinomycetota bacterium]
MTVDAGEVVERVAARPARSGLFLDLDGTLAPIVARPELARVLPDARAVLPRLVGRVAVVAVVSGRPSDQVRELVDVDGVLAVGTHGVEGEPPMSSAVLDAIREVAASVGAWVEPKGAAAAVHFRGVEDPLAAATAAEPALGAVAAANGLELLGGKRILELMPAGRPRKGGAVERISRDHGLEVVVFAGDDVGDLDAFAALGRLGASGVWTCGVVSQGSETASAVVEAGDFAVSGPPGVVTLLTAIADALDVAS